LEPTPRPNPPIPQLIAEIRDLVVAYLKQETVVPLRQLRRYLVLGLAGSLLIGFAVLFLALAGLRALQTETGETFSGNWSWAPYGIVVVALALGGAIAFKLAAGRRAREDA
jgi:hypothetical protein